MGPPALLPIRKKACSEFVSPLKSIGLAGLEPATFGSSGNHTNHYDQGDTGGPFPGGKARPGRDADHPI
jgi:hypothetical protein